MNKFLRSRYTRMVVALCVGIALMFFIAPSVINLVGLQTYEVITTGSGLIVTILLIAVAFAAGTVFVSMFREHSEQKGNGSQH